LRAAAATKEAVLMKDFVLDARQIACAARLGASAVLLIQAVMGRRGGDALAATLIQAAHDHGLEVVLEASTAAEYVAAKETEADILGINHRDLRTMAVDAAATSTILTAHGKDRPVMAMSGISTRREIEGLKAAGADAFLVGSALVTAPDPEARLRTLVGG
jgi:indole-3-glycerol phosphate synthase